MSTASTTKPCPPRLSPDTEIALRDLSHLIGERGHAAIWAENYRERHGHLPNCTQILIGLNTDLGLEISPKSAERALQMIRERDLAATV